MGASLALAVLVATGCTPRPLLERAIRARGGPLGAVVRRVEAEVHAGFPGMWRWRTAFLVPDRYAWTIFTTGEPDHYLFDGTTMRAFVGRRPVVVQDDGPLRTHARFAAVTNLDTLRLPGVQVAPLPSEHLPPGAVAGLAAVFADDGSRYRLAFDDRALLVWVAGPMALPPFGEGELVARFTDLRRVHGFLLPFRTTYIFGSQLLAEERALAVCPNDPRLTERSFREPAALPDCSAEH